MKTFLLRLTGCCSIFLAIKAMAVVHYVDLNSTNATPPYADWTTAATNIQDAIDASTNGDTVLVTNGVYSNGGSVAIAGDSTNRVTLTSAITVQSVNGPWVTVIQGISAATGKTSVRCAWLTNNATLIGFTLEGGGTYPSGTLAEQSGGGVWCAATNCFVDDCVIVSNAANQNGSGVYKGTYNNCLISSNNTLTGHPVTAVYNAYLINCTVVNNSMISLNGSSKLTNCIVYYNDSTQFSGTAGSHCCATTLLTGPGNFTNAPQLFVDGVHLLDDSPCIDAGTNVNIGTDIFGQAWANPPSVGCAEYYPAPLVTQPNVILTGNPAGLSVNAAATGSPSLSCFWLKDGVALQDNGHLSATQTTNLLVASVTLADTGDYQLVASNSFGVTTSTVVSLVIHAVDAGGVNPEPPYLTWAAAATNIQDAVNAASPGDVILVTNGVYSAGGKSEDGLITNRVALDKAIRVQSVNGPWVTTIQGGGYINGPSAVRCAWLTNNALLIGFTLSEGATLTTGSATIQESGGGVWCAASNCFVDNCVIVSNVAVQNGSGAYQGTLQNCLVSSNGVAPSAVYAAILNSCTVVSNANIGVRQGTMTNCIAYYNSSLNYQTLSSAAFCCATPAIAGLSNIASAPMFQGGGVQLAIGSPCIGAGTNLVIGTDLFGLPWANPPSVGCAEYNPAPTVGQLQITYLGSPAGFTIGSTSNGGQPPLGYAWLLNGAPLPTNANYGSTATNNLVVSGVNLAEAGSYQLVISNAYGAVTSSAVQFTVHVVDAAGTNPQPPFTTWATAAVNIQDAIETAAPGDIVLVTNGVYDTSGEVMVAGLTNRVAVDRAIMVASVNGFSVTTIEGALDPVSTNGPAAVRCAWLTNGAVLTGFTLAQGATLTTGDTTALQSGGGVWCASSNALVSNCVLTNNYANYGGGGINSGTLNNSLVSDNVAASGGGAYNSTLNNCTVTGNYTTSAGGGGVWGGFIQNSIVQFNYYGFHYGGFFMYNPSQISDFKLGLNGIHVSYGSSDSAQAGTSNIVGNPQFLDAYHISIYSPCRSGGSALYATGTDLDGNPWSTPPSIGCVGCVFSNRVGPLLVSFQPFLNVTNVVVDHQGSLFGVITGEPADCSWTFGDGSELTNASTAIGHTWTNTGDYSVSFTAYNFDYPAGVADTRVIHVTPLASPQLQSLAIVSNTLDFQFTEQTGVTYTIQYTTDLTPPVAWTTLRTDYDSFGGVSQIQDSAPTNASRFYRVLAQ